MSVVTKKSYENVREKFHPVPWIGPKRIAPRQEEVIEKTTS